MAKKPAVITPALLAAVSTASSMQTKTNDKWVHAATLAFKSGVTVAMITKPTEEEPNPQFDEENYTKLWDATMLGVSAGKGELKFAEANPFATGAEQLGISTTATGRRRTKKKEFHRWTVQQVLALDKAGLRLVTDPILRTQRKVFQQNVGTMMNALRRYIDRLENPDKERAAKTSKKNKKAEAPESAPLLERGKAMLLELSAKLLALKRADGTTMDGVVQAHEAVLETLARLGQVK